jgi:spermidine synthase
LIRLVLAILIMGFSGIVAQILLLRELLITFYGNELSIGIILANWLILEATGSFFIGKRIEKLRSRIEAFVGFTLLFSLFFPVAIYLVRVWKGLAGVTPGEGVGLLLILCSSFLILLPVSLPHGALFTFGCKIFSLYSSAKCRSPAKGGAGASGGKEDATSIGKVYIYETIGTIVGGISFTYLLITYFHSLQIALGVALLNIIACVYLLSPPWRDTRTAANKILGGVAVMLLVLCAYLMVSPKADQMHRLSIKKQWQSQDIIHYQNSIYGNVAVTRSAEQYTFFSDGIPIITTPTPDIVFMEEFVHLPMLFHPNPREILIISGGAGGLINEILKHPVERIDYVELDPLILEVVKKFSTTLTEAELSDPKVNIHYVDGRLFIKKTLHRYDLVLVGLSNPQDLQTNRLFTKEFFSLVKNRLKREGILVISLPGSLTYLSKELKDLNACILNTLKEVYPHLRIIPGDGTNLYLASKSQGLSLIDQAQFGQRLQERNLKVSLLTTSHIEYKLHHRWLSWFLESLQGGTEKINQDFRPLGVFYSLSYWNARFSPYMQKIFGYFEKVSIGLVFVLAGIFVLFSIFLNFRIRYLSRASMPFAIASTGFAGMIFDLALIFTFQALYGFVFYWIGLLTTAFMVGVAVGSLVMTSLLARIKKDVTCFLKIEAAIAIFSGMLPLIFLKFSPYLDHPAIFLLLQIVFLVLSVLSGILIGAEFPLANKIHLTPLFQKKDRANLSRTAGLLYGSDLLGGWVGGIIGGVVLLPVLGLFKTCVIVVILKISSLIIVATSARRSV